MKQFVKQGNALQRNSRNDTILPLQQLWKPGAVRLNELQPSLKNVRQKIPPNSPLILDLVTKISQHIHFRYFRHHFGSTFPRNATKPMFRCFPTTSLMRWRFQHTCRWIWRFRGCPRHSPKGKKPNNWLKKHGGISAYRKAFLIFWRWIFKENNGGNMILTVFYSLNFLDIEFYN